MPIEFHCPFCDQMLRTPDEQAGRQAKCPGCGENVFVPHESEVVAEESVGGDWFDQLGDLHAKPSAKETAESSREQETGESPAETATCPICGEPVDTADRHCPACGEQIDQIAEARTQPVYAGFWLRCAAALIDGVILAIPLTLILAVCLPLLANLNWQFLLDLSDFWLPELALLLLTWPYFAALEGSRYQATFGKLLLGLIVTDVNGKRLSFARATGRHWAKLISSFCCLLGFFTAAFDERKQAWHDSIAGCLVIRRPVDPESSNASNDTLDEFSTE